MSADHQTGSRPVAPALGTLRRIILFILLFALLSLTASGVGSLLGWAFTAGDVLVAADSSSLALALALTLVGGPLGAIAFWASWRLLRSPAERRSTAWGIYFSAMYITSLITASSFILSGLAHWIGGDTGNVKTSLGQGLGWAAVWWWHRWMLAHSTRGPVALATVPTLLGWAFGLVLGLGAASNALGLLFDRALGVHEELAVVGSPWWRGALGLLVWAVGGAVIWWWHWFRSGASTLHTALAGVAVVSLGVGVSSILALGGVGMVLFVLLRLGLDRSDPLPILLDPAPEALAAALLGLLSWLYHARIVSNRPAPLPTAAGLAISGITLIAWASGLGVVVNAGLSTVTTHLGGTDSLQLLLAGLSSLAVGGPLWWFSWRPARSFDQQGRRIYLVLVFGISAVVSLVTLLVIGFRLFEFILGDASTSGLLERVRAPVGLLLATALVAGYHFVLWRHARELTEHAEAPGVPGSRPHLGLSEVVLVAGADAPDLAAVIRAHTGAHVMVLLRHEPAGATLSVEQVLQSLRGHGARRILLLVGPGDRLEATALADDSPMIGSG
ncbi:DUF5671 domain-containing protein [Paeniglutamicibacter sp. Y32M11]|uniref:DUF5671 domain-containing protein n=1 Tax=Paeniglutamicibacter sp. Y32M11 TaxID=2853258 RepID=UPI001C52E044|nr:DUF5671 domain-containing protein [Paeniglutamicibacter sp. Y32M11]QXQ10768.1 hypothetical protein KUF55_02140 [Paeniglutamicibacter sp. Y32M11]